MSFRGAAAIVLLALGAGRIRAEAGWTVRSPAIARKADRAERALAVSGLAAAAIVFWARRRRR